MDRPVPPRRFTSICTKKEKISTKVFRATFTLKEPDEITFRAGQNIMLYVAEGQNRAMSIGSPPSESHALTIFYDVSPMGVGSKWMIALNEGEEVRFMGPLGIFTYRPTPRKKVLVATGTGVAPFRAMVLDHYRNGGTDEIVLWWGLRHEEDMFLTEELERLHEEFPTFTYHVTLSSPTDAWTGVRGRVTAHVLQETSDPAGQDYYLCGNGGMVEDMKKQLHDASVPADQIHSELFFG